MKVQLRPDPFSSKIEAKTPYLTKLSQRSIVELLRIMDDIQSLKEVIQSSNINFLIGAGLSTPFLPTLNSIETRLVAEKDAEKRIEIYKEYFEKVMLPNCAVADGTISKAANSDFKETYESYQEFFNLIAHILLGRKSTILSKQANIFTTNIDILMETALEEANLEYNDGFTGQLSPTFSLSNFKKTISKRSLHFENISEIPTFNIIKMHGSLTWVKGKGDNIVFSKLGHINKSLLKKTGADFTSEYQKILIVNPEKKKFQETVMDVNYYELLRMYSSELEKENTVLFVMGCSMADEHIQQITVRSANSNPTLKIYIFCHSNKGVEEMKKNMSYETLKYSNISIIGPVDDAAENSYNLHKINDSVFKNILLKKNETQHD